MNIVRPSSGGISHNKFREYNIDTRGLILNNSGLGGTSLTGGAVAPNPNLSSGQSAKIIVNEVTGSKRSTLNGVTEVFGGRADVILANPNGVACAGCGFINTGTATLTTGLPVIDYNAGTIGLETRKGEITVSGTGVSAPAGQMPDAVRLIGKSIRLDGAVDANDSVLIGAGSSRTDSSGNLLVIDDQPGAGVVSSSAGVIRAGSIEVLSSDPNTSIDLKGNLQALGTINPEGHLVDGRLSVISAGSIGIVAGEVAGSLNLVAGHALEVARDLSASGEIAITASDISLLNTSGVHAGKSLSIIAQGDLTSEAVLKSGRSMLIEAGDTAWIERLVAAHDGVDLAAGRKLSTNNATFVSKTLTANAPSVELERSWVVPSINASISGTNVTLGENTAFDPDIPVVVAAQQRLTIGTKIDPNEYPALTLAFRDLGLSETGVFAVDEHKLNLGILDNAGTLVSRGKTVISARSVENRTTGIMQAESISISVSDDLTNLGHILSKTTIAVLAEGNVRNDGLVSAIDVLDLKIGGTAQNAATGEIAAGSLKLQAGNLANNGSILSQRTLTASVTGSLTNTGILGADGDLRLDTGNLVSAGLQAVIDSGAALTLNSSGLIANLDGSKILSTGELHLVAGGKGTNAGILFSDDTLTISTLGFEHSGFTQAQRIGIDLGGGNLANLGRIVSADTLDVLQTGSVSNDGIIQAAGNLHLDASSYAASSTEAELVAEQADILLSGSLSNAGLIAVAQKLGLEAGADITNLATAEIVAREIEARIGSNLLNLGNLLSQETLKATITGVAANSGAIRAGIGLTLDASDISSSGAYALLESGGKLTLTSGSKLQNLDGASIVSTDALHLVAYDKLTNAGTIFSEDSLTIASGGFTNTSIAYSQIIDLDIGAKDFSNTGQLVSTDTMHILRADAASNYGIIQAGGYLRLEAKAYTANSAESELVAQNASLDVTGPLVNAGLIAASQNLDFDVEGDFRNATTGEIAGGIVQARIGGELGNLGAILSEGAFTATISDAFSNKGIIRARGDLSLTADDIGSSGSQAAVDSGGNLALHSRKDISVLADAKLIATGNLSLHAESNLKNSGVLYSGTTLSVDALGYGNSGFAQANAINIDLHNAAFTNNGQIVSRDTLDMLRISHAVNDGIIQARSNLRLEAQSYTSNFANAELVAGELSITLSGSMSNAGLLAVSNGLQFDVGTHFSNIASGQIAAGEIDAQIRGNFNNAGVIASDSSTVGNIGGTLQNSGKVHANDNLTLTAADITVSGASAFLVGIDGASLISSGNIRNLGGTIASHGGLTLKADQDLTNSGLLEGRNDLSVSARHLANEASGNIHAGAIQQTAGGAVPIGSMTVELAGNLNNLGNILSANTLSAVVTGTTSNSGSIEAGRTLLLDTYAYIPTSAGARLIANSMDLVLGSSFTTAGTLAAAGRLGLTISGNLINAENATLEAGTLDIYVTQNLTNRGSLLSSGAMTLDIAGTLENHNIVRSGSGMIINAAKLINSGAGTVIGSNGNLAIDVSGNMENALGSILSEGMIDLKAGGALINSSARIESVADMTVSAQSILNTALAGTNGGTIDFYDLGRLTINLEYDKDTGFSTDYETWYTARQDEFSGTIQLSEAGVIRSGGDMSLDVGQLHNTNGRMLAVGDLSIASNELVNDAQVYYVDHYRQEWGYYTDDGYYPLYPPTNSNWFVRGWSANFLTETGFEYLLSGLNKRSRTETELVPATSSTPGAQRVFGPAGLGYYVEVETTVTEYGVGETWETVEVSGSDGPRETTRLVPAYYTEEYLRTPEGRQLLFNEIGTLLISTGSSPVTVRGSDDVSQSQANRNAKVTTIANADTSRYLNLAALGIAPDNIPETIALTAGSGKLGSQPYNFKGKSYIGKSEVSQGSVIKAAGRLSVNSTTTTNRGTLSGNLVTIDGGTLHNGLGRVQIDAPASRGFASFDADAASTGSATQTGALNPNRATVNVNTGSQLVGPHVAQSQINATSGSPIASLPHDAIYPRRGGASGSVDFVLDDVAVPPLDLGDFNARALHSVDLRNFGNLERYTGSLEAARLLSGVGAITDPTLAFYADPVQEAKAFAEAMRSAAGSQMVLDPSLSPQAQRELLYANAAAFAERTGAQFGVALSEAQRAALDQPLVWYERRIVDGKPVLAPRLYLPSADELLRGVRGAGLIDADDLLVDLSGRLTNSGTIAVAGLASISASSIVNQRMLNLDSRDRDYAAGRADSGLISAATLLMTTDGDLINRGGTLAASGDIELRIGGSVLNLTQRYTRAVDAFDGCMGSACGGDAADFAIARITAGRDLTIIADTDIVNRGGELGSVTDMLLAAGRNVEFETLKDAFLSRDFHQRGFLSGTDIVEHTIVSAEAAAQSLLGDVSIFSGYGVCDGGSLCARGKGDTVLNGALVSAFGDLAVTASGEIDMGVVSQEVHNTYGKWGFAGLGWGSVRQKWNDVETSVTRLSGGDVLLNATGPITGTGAKIAAVNDLIMQSDATIRLEAAQDARYFTEKGFYIGLTFPGSAAIEAALKGGDAGDIAAGLGSISPLTATLARLGSSGNGLAAGLAATYAGVGGWSGIEQLLSGDATLAQRAGLTPDALQSQIGIAMSGWRTDRRWSESQASQLAAGGDIVLKAGLDALLTQGTQAIAGGDVRIEAQRDIEVSALLDYARQTSTAWGLTVSLEGVSGSISKAAGEAVLATNGAVQAGGAVELVAGRDVNLIGGNAVGERVSVDAGRDLTIASLQDTSRFRQSGVGLSISFDGAVGGNYASTKADYANVNRQAGIVAGDGGYDVTAGGTVDLTAGLIVSSADPALNSLEAERLVVRDLENKSEASTSGFGVSVSGGVPSPIVSQPASEESSGTAQSTISQGSVTLHDQNGDGVADTPADRIAQADLLASLNRDPASANVQVEMYDLEALQAKQQDATVISRALNLAVGDIANVAGFAEGSPEKVALHAVAGALTAAVSGGNIGTGALAGGASEAINALLLDVLDDSPALTPDQRAAVLQWGAALVGAAIGGVDGAAVALDNINNNYLTHEQIEAFAREMEACGSDAACKEEVKWEYREKSLANDLALASCLDAACRQMHYDEIGRAQGAAQQYINIHTEADPEDVAALFNLQNPEHISQLMEISLQREQALNEAREQCGSDSACVTRTADELFNSRIDRKVFLAALAGGTLGRVSVAKGGSVKASGIKTEIPSNGFDDLSNLNNLKGANSSAVEAAADIKFVSELGWIKAPLKDGNGVRYFDGKGNSVQINKGYPNFDDPTHGGPYLKVSNGGKITRIPLNGNPGQ